MQHARTVVSTAMVLAIVSAIGGCSSGGNSNNGDPTDFHGQLSDALLNNLSGFGTALKRLALAVNGTAQTGVTLTDITNGVQGTVGVDVDGDGAMETSVAGKLVYLNAGQGLAGGANFTLTGITGGAPQTASGSATVTQTGPAVLTISNGAFTTHTDTRGNNLSVSQASISADASGTDLVLTGTAHFTFNALTGTLTFQPDGQGSFRIQVSGSGFTTFTVP